MSEDACLNEVQTLNREAASAGILAVDKFRLSFELNLRCGMSAAEAVAYSSGLLGAMVATVAARLEDPKQAQQLARQMVAIAGSEAETRTASRRAAGYLSEAPRDGSIRVSLPALSSDQVLDPRAARVAELTKQLARAVCSQARYNNEPVDSVSAGAYLRSEILAAWKSDEAKAAAA